MAALVWREILLAKNKLNFGSGLPDNKDSRSRLKGVSHFRWPLAPADGSKPW